MGQLMESFELENPILSEIDANIERIDPKELVSERFITIVKYYTSNVELNEPEPQGREVLEPPASEILPIQPDFDYSIFPKNDLYRFCMFLLEHDAVQESVAFEILKTPKCSKRIRNRLLDISNFCV